MPYGPCNLCGDTDYARSTGGDYICPACDCGYPPALRPRGDWADELALKVSVCHDSDRASIIREHCEEKGWRAQFEEASLQLNRISQQLVGIDAMQRELEDIQQMVGCNHVEGLARCVRERISP